MKDLIYIQENTPKLVSIILPFDFLQVYLGIEGRSLWPWC